RLFAELLVARAPFISSLLNFKRSRFMEPRLTALVFATSKNPPRYAAPIVAAAEITPAARGMKTVFKSLVGAEDDSLAGFPPMATSVVFSENTRRRQRMRNCQFGNGLCLLGETRVPRRFRPPRGHSCMVNTTSASPAPSPR